MTETRAIILAAGVSSRMKTDTPKVLHKVCGRPMLQYVLDACKDAGIEKTYVIVGYGAEQVKQAFTNTYDITWILQAEQLGTAHAVMCCTDYLKDFTGNTLVLCGDGPLIRPETLKTLIETHLNSSAALTLATAIIDNPNGYGRIVRNSDGSLKEIVEHKDCSEKQLQIKEINPSYYIFDNKILFETLQKVKPDNVQHEYYLTDALSIILQDGHKVTAVNALQPQEAMSANTKQQLEQINQIMEERLKTIVEDS
ncbi:MAG: sugar phosphate nucleotidyltransferase [Planctomycetota bacterium]|jgi:bifunctional UDP-N-acetylglucosamine pyrophosphorylase/glucosamine-1-phosphate N-acetyltransferase